MQFYGEHVVKRMTLYKARKKDVKKKQLTHISATHNLTETFNSE